MTEYKKGGAIGAYRVIINDNGTVKAAMSVDGELREFISAREAYNWYKPMTENNHSAWNICYALEDHIS